MEQDHSQLIEKIIETKLNNNTMTEGTSVLQVQINNLSNEINRLNLENNNLKRDGDILKDKLNKIKSDNDILKSKLKSTDESLALEIKNKQEIKNELLIANEEIKNELLVANEEINKYKELEILDKEKAVKKRQRHAEEIEIDL